MLISYEWEPADRQVNITAGCPCLTQWLFYVHQWSSHQLVVGGVVTHVQNAGLARDGLQ